MCARTRRRGYFVCAHQEETAPRRLFKFGCHTSGPRHTNVLSQEKYFAGQSFIFRRVYCGAEVTRMAETINLKTIERRAWASYFDDGLWDIYLGLLLFAMFSELFLSAVGMSWGYIVPEPIGNLAVSQVVLLVLAFLVLFAGKRLVTVPRMGVVRFGPGRKARLWKIGIVFVITAIIGLLFAWEIVPSGLSVGIPLPLVAWIMVSVLGFGLAAYLLDFNRLYLYGALFAASLVSFVLLKQAGFPTVGLSVVVVSAAIMMAVGTVLLFRFLRKYPRPLEVQ